MTKLKISQLGALATLIVVSWPAFGSDFYAGIVVLAAFGIAGVLIVQTLIGIVLVLDKRYTSKDPILFVGFALVVLLVGVFLVLNESAHLAKVDLLILFPAMLVPGATAILPPLIQRAKSKR